MHISTRTMNNINKMLLITRFSRPNKICWRSG